jgi:hypothetical protein
LGTKSHVLDRDHGWKAFFRAVEAARGARHAKVGVLADTEKGGMHEEGGDLTVAEIAAVLEFGTEDGHIPERSVIRATFDEQREALTEMTYELVAAILFGDMTADQALNALGAKLAAEMKKKITTGQGVPPPNAPSTILAKGGAKLAGAPKSFGAALAQVGIAAAVKPWVDSGRVLGALTWAVVNGRPDEGE